MVQLEKAEAEKMQEPVPIEEKEELALSVLQGGLLRAASAGLAAAALALAAAALALHAMQGDISHNDDLADNDDSHTFTARGGSRTV